MSNTTGGTTEWAVLPTHRQGRANDASVQPDSMYVVPGLAETLGLAL